MAGKELCMTTGDTTNPTTTSTTSTSTSSEVKPHSSDYNFDHLSVVSEENFTNSDGGNSIIDPTICASAQLPQPMSLLIHPLPVAMSNDQSHLTPLTPIELIATQLNELQNAVPPLSYFENIANERMQDKLTPGTSNGWDFGINSSFQIVALSPSNTSVPTILTSPVASPVLQHKTQSVTSPPTLPQPQNSPKNFFSTLKPRPLPVTSPPLPAYPEEVAKSPLSQSTEYIEPIYAQVKKLGRTSQEQIVSRFCFFVVVIWGDDRTQRDCPLYLYS